MALVVLAAFSMPAPAAQQITRNDHHAAPDIPLKALYGLGKVDYFELDRPNPDGTSHPYYILTSVPDPEAYGAGPWPTIYLLDGGTNFPMLAAYHRYLLITEVLPPMIIVGISYGTDDFKEGNSRSTDYTAPSEERKHYGGAEAFDAFLAERLMPAVQNRHAVDADRQFLFGQSLGGQFALYTAMYGTAPFAAVIASNPALHRNLEFFKQPLREKPTYARTFISSAEHDAPRFRGPALEWQAHWQDKAPQWQRNFVDLPEHTHLSANPDVFLKGLLWLGSSGTLPMP